MSELPRKSESYSSQRWSGDTRIASITWLPLVTGVARSTVTGGPAGIGNDQMLARATYTAYASRRPSTDREIEIAPSPVVSRDASPRGRPDVVSVIAYTSRG